MRSQVAPPQVGRIAVANGVGERFDNCRGHRRAVRRRDGEDTADIISTELVEILKAARDIVRRKNRMRIGFDDDGAAGVPDAEVHRARYAAPWVGEEANAFMIASEGQDDVRGVIGTHAVDDENLDLLPRERGLIERLEALPNEVLLVATGDDDRDDWAGHEKQVPFS